jgi:hypothetical protein
MDRSVAGWSPKRRLSQRLSRRSLGALEDHAARRVCEQTGPGRPRADPPDPFKARDVVSTPRNATLSLMEFGLWPIASRQDLVRAFRPGAQAKREGPYRTLRDHGWATGGVALPIRHHGKAAGRVMMFSILNVEAAICARCGDRAAASWFMKAAGRIEASQAFARLLEHLAPLSARAASSVVEGSAALGDPELGAILRTLASETETVRHKRMTPKQFVFFHIGRVSSMTDSYVVVTSEGGTSLAVPRLLARAAHREKVGECLGVLNSQVDNHELIVRAVPGIELAPQGKPYSPFDRVAFDRISDADAAYLRGQPVPLTIRIPVTIER